MKLKPTKETVSFLNVFKEMFSKNDKSSDTSLSIDIEGGITLENFKRLLSYTSQKATIETKQKIVYIYGENIVITCCDKHFAMAKGDITKIELFSKEV